MKDTKRSLLTSVVALLLCFSMLLGTTYAWFTDSAQSAGNVIQSGNLDIEMYWSDRFLTADSDEWKLADEKPIFTHDNWEPGYTDVKYVKIKNAGNLSFKWKLSLEAEGQFTDLADVIDVYYVDPAVELTSLAGRDSVGTLAEVATKKTSIEGVLLPENEISNEYATLETVVAIALHMDEAAGNKYQDTDLGCGFSVSLIATQFGYEEDSFNKEYDKDSDWPVNVIVGALNASANVDLTADNKVATGVNMSARDSEGNEISAEVPAGVSATKDKLTLTITTKEKSDANIVLNETEAILPLDVHIDGVAEDNEVVIKIKREKLLPEGLNLGNHQLYHVEDGKTVAMTLLESGAQPEHNNYEYDPTTGDVVFYLKSFSEVAVVAEPAKWEGNFDYSWYTNAVAPIDGETVTEYTIANADQLAAFGAIVGAMNGQTQDSFAGKTVKLVADINLGDKESENNPKIIFYPIGYYNSEGTYERTNTAITSGLRNFEGTFDGNGHTISNFYHNTWEMKGDHDWYSPAEQYYRDGMGLFGRVYKGTVKNLTVENFSSDGEIATTGVIAAYADGATFENIAIFNCNPRVYNIGNGGIVGCVGWYAKQADLKTTFKNITVDNSNKISALWGSYDVPCGGIVGQYYPTSGQTSAGTPKNAGLYFENCHVSAQLDVYNDVCANYQYYAYRYAGMLIGSVRENVTIDGHVYPKMDGINAKDCTVHFGDWNDYYYCELVANSLASYTHDHQMSRLEQVASVDVANKTVTDLEGNTTAIPTSGRVNYVVVKAKGDDGEWIHGDGHNYAECYHFVNGVQHFHDVADADNPNPTETVNGVEGILKEDKQLIYREFNNLVTGYGWGVTTKGVDDLDGVTILDREVGNSVKKFEGKATELANNKEYKLGDIFDFVDNGVELVPGSLAVGVTSIDENNPVSTKIVYDRDNWKNGTLTLTGTGKVQITIQDYYFCTPTTITVDVKDRQPEVKFDVVMNNGDFLHRVGNSGTVALDKLFKAKEGVTVGTVSVTVEAVNGTSASGTYSNNAIQFNGTGVVKVTITDNDYCTPTILYLEVVDAVNAIGATNATKNNVVLLNDISGGFTVSDGYAFYGNGFKVTCSGKGTSLNATGMSQGYINVTSGGILDNVRVICDIYPVAYLYASEVQVNSNIDNSYNIAGKTYYMYQLSAVAISGNSTISNSYIYGARNNIFVDAGNVNVENTVVECGSVANIHIKSTDAYTVTLDNVTTIQYLASSKYDTSKNVMGFGVLIGDNESETNAKIVLEGDLKQYNWVNKSHHTGENVISNSHAKTAIELALAVSEYQHTIDNTTTINMGIAVLNAKDFNYEDNRINKNTIPYALNDVTMMTYKGQVYSITSNSGIDESNRYNAETDGVIPYTPNAQKAISPQVSHSGVNGSSLTINTAYNNAWITTFTADLDNITGGNYSFTFNDLVIKKYDKELTYTVKDSSGKTIDKSTAITLNQLHSGKYTLIVTDNAIYNSNGELSGEMVTYEMPFVLYATKTSIDPPKFVGIGSGVDGAIRLVSSKGGNWRPAYPALQGVSVTYWSASESKVKTIDLSTLTNKGTISGQTWTYTCDDFTLKIIGGPVHTTTSYVLSPMIANRDGTDILYFAAANKDNSTGTTARLICLEYVFTDKNASTTVGQCTSYSNGIATVQYANLPEYSWSSFQKGKVEEPSNSNPCVTPDTLITLADGTQKEIQNVTNEDIFKVWDFYKGEYAYVPGAVLINHGEGLYKVITLTFDDGTSLKIVGMHGLYNCDLNDWVYIDDANVESYVGTTFVKTTDDNLITEVKLVGYSVVEEVTTAYSMFTALHYNCFFEDILTLTPSMFIEGENYYIPFEIGEDMKYDEVKMQEDIEKYGLYSYDDFSEYVTYEQFVGFNAAYFKVSVGKGLVTYDQLIESIYAFVN